MSNNTDYRMVRLVDGSTIMGTITVDKDFLRITNALELHTVQRMTEFGAKDDSSLAPWLHFTDDKTFVIPRDKIIVITQADRYISNYYEVILNKLTNETPKHAPLTTDEINKILKIADELDRQERGEEYSEEDIDHLVDGTKTVH